MTDIAGYTALACLVVVVPGADTLVVVRNTLSGGSGSAVRTTTGVCTGLAAWALLSSAGLAAAVAASPTLFAVLRVAGAVYLVLLGAQAIIAGSRVAEPELPAGRDWRQGALTNLGNPKVGVFYTSLLPQFLPSHGSTLGAAALLASIHIALSFLSLLAYGVLAARMGHIFREERWRKVLERCAGTALCAVGLWLMVSAVAGT
ncbi:LysE family translocator [Streptomyces sp. NPDC048415]|uniref:LysE family translocator n=1 Tax=Streptomyces sp. NPDC048415 TaxID=3154822 RepID=UPI00343BECC9